jgi:hypothetical protein
VSNRQGLLTMTQEAQWRSLRPRIGLVTLVGPHDTFEDARKCAEQAREKCVASRQALKQHLAPHKLWGVGSSLTDAGLLSLGQPGFIGGKS